MSRRSVSCWLVAFIALVAAGAEAGTLTSATWLQVAEGIPMTRTNGQFVHSGTSTGSSISVSLSYPQATLSVFVPKAPVTGLIDLHITVTQGGAQNLTATPSMANATQGIPGTVAVMTANHAAMGVNQSMWNVGLNTLVRIPLNVGVSGQQSATFILSGVTHTVAVNFFAWTPHTLTFTGLTSKYAPLGTPTVVAMGSFMLNNGLIPMASTVPASQTLTGTTGGGTVTLVSPTLVNIDGAFAARRTVSLTTLKLGFAGTPWSVHGTLVPEPGTLLLLGSAGVAVALARRRS